VLIDLTFELWGQKHIIDAGLLAAGDLDWMSNVDDSQPNSAGPLQVRQLLYQRAATMPAECMLIGNLRADLPAIQETFATAIGSAPVLLGDLRRLSQIDRQWYREKISWFKKLRRTTKISESFFPLGSWLQTTPAAWDGYARLARCGSGVIALFRNKWKGRVADVQLPLMPAGRYKIRSVITDKDLGIFEKSIGCAAFRFRLRTRRASRSSKSPHSKSNWNLTQRTSGSAVYFSSGDERRYRVSPTVPDFSQRNESAPRVSELESPGFQWP